MIDCRRPRFNSGIGISPALTYRWANRGKRLNPLTHHEILELIGPFTRRGRQVDLAATDRLQRRLVFKPIDHPESTGLLGVRETLALDDLGAGAYRLTRLLTPASGPAAAIEAEGPDPGELLARIAEVPPRRQLRAAEGVAMAISFRLEAASGSEWLSVTRAAAHVAGLRFELDASMATREPASVALTRAPGDELRLPPDALAVLGGQWSRLRDSADGWTAELRLRRREPHRSRQAEAALETAARHLARMLAEAPGRFHQRWAAARWRVFCRRLVPLAVCIGLILCAAAVPKLHLAEGSGLRMLIINSPPLLMILYFCLREIPIIEIPPLPRRSHAASWRKSEDAPVEGTCSPIR